MLIILFIIGIVLVILGSMSCYMRNFPVDSDLGSILCTIGGIITVTVSILMIPAITHTVKIPQMEERIAIYKEENSRIEEQIKTAIEVYQDYEQGIFEDIDLENISSERLILLTSIYPELKSDVMVQELIQVYINNTNEIKLLRTQKLNYDVWRWWLCFG